MADFVFADDYRLDDGPTRAFFEEFLKGMVHKHNNLMGVIQGFSSLILYDESINSEVRESAEQMQESARTASDLNRDALPAAGCNRLDMGAVDLSQMLSYWTGKSAEICQEEDVSVEINPRENLPAVKGDSGKITEIFTHLLRNAAEAAAELPTGTVAIDIFPPGEASPGNNVDLFIRNSSVEMYTDALKKSFVPFHTSKGSEHFGLGLTTAAILAGQMGMRLGLRYAEGTTTAWLAMPAAD